MDCWICERPALAACRFCGRGACREHAKSHPFVLDVYRGRVFSFYDMIFNGMFVAGFAVAAALLPPNGRSPAVLALIGIGYALAAAAYWLTARNTSSVATAGSNLRA